MRHHDRPGHPGNLGHTPHPHDAATDFASDPSAADAPATADARATTDAPAARVSGRHRKGGRARRHAARRPSFRTAVTVAGSAAAVLTVATGMYVAFLGTGGTTTAPSAAEPVVALRSAGAGGADAAPESVRQAGSVREVEAVRVAGSGREVEAVRVAGPISSVPSAPSTAATPFARTAVTAPAGSAPAAPRPQTPPKAESERRRGPRPEQAPERPGPAQPQGRQQEQRGAAPVAEAGAGKAARFVQDVIALANAERERAGCGPLHSESHLRTAAQGHADDMSARDYYEHDNPEGRDAGDRMTGAGYTWSTWGENIHRGPKTPVRAMEDWMDSPGHRANILNCAFKDIGVGVTLTANGPWWVQNFGARR
ncbi:CAP domain-containing protein [Streptomyces sp. TX20-6-3]|uniref:CAP domain-containing protein n=1 Tax=Streptomyces sp. TX20-6-3 TaxID=3028705 RepID=UPI0029BC8547|nr:CAP domain-containing protein [Streptomyces sp. TX20-6-3]MDX2560836.1 CAP domain-containing protein [Streptomyces sp. TX20-6-3]